MEAFLAYMGVGAILVIFINFHFLITESFDKKFGSLRPGRPR